MSPKNLRQTKEDSFNSQIVQIKKALIEGNDDNFLRRVSVLELQASEYLLEFPTETLSIITDVEKLKGVLDCALEKRGLGNEEIGEKYGSLLELIEGDSLEFSEKLRGEYINSGEAYREVSRSGKPGILSRFRKNDPIGSDSQDVYKGLPKGFKVRFR